MMARAGAEVAMVNLLKTPFGVPRLLLTCR